MPKQVNKQKSQKLILKTPLKKKNPSLEKGHSFTMLQQNLPQHP
jgi:hypothetical protein